MAIKRSREYENWAEAVEGNFYRDGGNPKKEDAARSSRRHGTGLKQVEN